MQTLPIESHGVIGNMRAMALVDINAAIDFFCFPSFDSPTVFSALLDSAKGGVFRIDPTMKTLRSKQLYLPDTNILVTRFLSVDGMAELTDFMPVIEGERVTPYAHQIIRMLRVIRGKISFQLLCAPRFDYGRVTHKAVLQGDAIHFRPESGDCGAMALHASVPLRVHEEDAAAEFSLAAGESAIFTFGGVRDGQTAEHDHLDRRYIEEQFEQTTKFWRGWISHSKYTGRWREIVHRSALALKLLTSHEHGSVVAAATFGLPEQPGGSRNWDYRYAWLRDSAFSMYAFMRLGFYEEATKFTSWLRERVIDGLKLGSSDGPLQIMYRADGSPDLDESNLDHLEGYRGARPVRIGNSASTQLQLDI
jgi:GH15 family glucan-1,4-alpha-glucosidase